MQDQCMTHVLIRIMLYLLKLKYTLNTFCMILRSDYTMNPSLNLWKEGARRFDFFWHNMSQWESVG